MAGRLYSLFQIFYQKLYSSDFLIPITVVLLWALSQKMVELLTSEYLLVGPNCIERLDEFILSVLDILPHLSDGFNPMDYPLATWQLKGKRLQILL